MLDESTTHSGRAADLQPCSNPESVSVLLPSDVQRTDGGGRDQQTEQPFDSRDVAVELELRTEQTEEREGESAESEDGENGREGDGEFAHPAIVPLRAASSAPVAATNRCREAA
jgi:hypothetical protein